MAQGDIRVLQEQADGSFKEVVLPPIPNLASPPAIGATAPNSAAFTTLKANNGTLAASAPALYVEQTWNGAGVNFVAAQINAIRASGSSSSADAELLRLSENGVEVFRFRRTGQILAPALTLTATTGNIAIGSNSFWFGNAGSAPSLTGASTTALDLRNGTNAMDFRIHGQYTNATNFERLSLKYNSTATAFQIGTEKGGTGGARALEFQTDGVTRMTIAASATTGTVSISGVVKNRALATNSWAAVDSLNSSGVQVGGFGYGGTSVSNFPDQMYFFSVGKDLVLAIASNGTNSPVIINGSTGLLSFYGKTSSFPALKRSSTTLQVRLANDSDFAPFECAALTLNGNLTASTRDIVTDTTTGTKIATGTTQKLGFWNATPVVQPAAVADATDAASTQARLNDLLGRLRTIGIIAT